MIEIIETANPLEFIVIDNGVNRGLFVTKTGRDQIPTMLEELEQGEG